MKSYGLVFVQTPQDPIMVSTSVSRRKLEKDAVQAQIDFHAYAPGVSEVAWYIGVYDSELTRHRNALNIAAKTNAPFLRGLK